MNERDKNLAEGDSSGGYHHGDLRSALVAAAGRLLEAEGLAAVSLRHVARAAGVSHAAPYRHFRDKHELLEAVAAEGFRDLEGRLEEIVRRLPDQPREQFLELGTTYVDAVLSHPHRSHLMFGGFLDPQRRSAELAAAEQSSFDGLVSVIRSAEASGLYREIPMRDVILALWSSAHGLAMLAAAGKLEAFCGQADPRELGRRQVHLLLEGLAR